MQVEKLVYGPVEMQSEVEFKARFPKSHYEPMLRDSEEASVQIFSLHESH